MALTYEQKKTIRRAQEKTTELVAEALKVKNLSLTEEMILKDILKDLTKRKTTPYEERKLDVLRNYLVVCGILYNHLSERTIDYGSAYTQPKYIAVSAVNTDGYINGTEQQNA